MESTFTPQKDTKEKYRRKILIPEGMAPGYRPSETEALLESRIFEVAEKPVEILFDVKVRYRLDGNDFIAEIPYGEMKFNSAGSSLSYISLLPMFGAVGAGEDGNYEEGYLLVPEGGGALDRKSTRLNSSHNVISRMPSSA